MKLFLQYLVAVIVLVVAVRQVIRLVRNPRDPALRVLAPGFVGLSIAKLQITGQPIYTACKELLGPFYSGVLNTLWVASAYCFATFFLMARDDLPLARRVRLARAPLIVMVLVMSYVTVLPIVHPAGFIGYDPRTWERISHYVPADVLAIIFFTVGIVRARRYLREVEHVWLRWSVRVLCVGAAGMALVDVVALAKFAVRLVQDADHAQRYPPLSVIYMVGLLGGQAALAVGLVLPAIGAAAGAFRRRYDRIAARRLGAEIRPLWQLLTSAFPYVILPGYQDAATPSHDKPLSRQVAEVSDALAQLAPYYRAAGLSEEAGAHGVESPAEAARILIVALELHAAGQERDAPPYFRLEPDHPRWRERATWMARTAQELKRQLPRTDQALVG